MSKIRVVTTKKDVPADTVSRKGFHLLNMGAEGNWLVDEDHPGYDLCVKTAIDISVKDGDSSRAKKYEMYPLGTFKARKKVEGSDLRPDDEAKKVNNVETPEKPTLEPGKK